MVTLRTELTAHGNGVGQLGNCLSDTVCHTISVFVNPAASHLVMEAAIEDILDKLERGAELLRTRSIAMAVLPTAPQRRMRVCNPPSQAHELCA